MFRHKWKGESGAVWRFRILWTDSQTPPVGGLYIFVRRRFFFWFTPLYIGKAAKLTSRLKGHERWSEAFWRREATEKHVLVVNSEEKRRRIEEDLIRRYKPVMNNILTPRGTEDAPRDEKLASKWARRFYWRPKKTQKS